MLCYCPTRHALRNNCLSQSPDLATSKRPPAPKEWLLDDKTDPWKVPGAKNPHHLVALARWISHFRISGGQLEEEDHARGMAGGHGPGEKRRSPVRILVTVSGFGCRKVDTWGWVDCGLCKENSRRRVTFGWADLGILQEDSREKRGRLSAVLIDQDLNPPRENKTEGVESRVHFARSCVSLKFDVRGRCCQISFRSPAGRISSLH
ncbi:hypothetical protein B0T16DRAFT_136354 [Cercophora newfieldiana]|uniref:Uncharacterized protein n=1 Tax=Cercophora newfieldiana TaxID=92897 RepID=A0AA39YEW3_9PEZI|nr:hypothetical protein B0T16DRAFT_136354 [Cercophora newfieldiana]